MNWIGDCDGVRELIRCIDAVVMAYRYIRRSARPRSLSILAYPNVIEGQSSKNDENRFPFSRSITEIGRDIQRVKDMGVDHIIFGYNFLPIGRNVDKMINLSKELSKFAR
ncbi:MAG: hypothetical protein WBZ36_20620 [Candidatus Nitrosopolaris sp.]